MASLVGLATAALLSPTSRIARSTVDDGRIVAREGAALSSRRALLASTPLLVLPQVSTAATPYLAEKPRVSVLSTPDVCQARCRDQDFVAVRYLGRFADGKPFDDRYASRPLIYELGSFYLPGVDEEVTGACVGTRLRFTWTRAPALGRVYEAVLPAGSTIELELELDNIRYSLFGEKMRNAGSEVWFAQSPLTLTSAADYERGHASARAPSVKKDNPFSIAPGEKSLISNPSSVLTPLFSGFFGNANAQLEE